MPVTLRSRFPGETFLRFRRDPLGFLERLAKRGDATRFAIGPQPMFFFSHPDAVREILVTRQHDFRRGRGLERAKELLGEGLLTSEGEHHLRQRRLAQPAFHRGRVAGYGDAMGAIAAQQVAEWPRAEAFDVHVETQRMALAIVGRTLFGADVGADADEIRGALATSLELFRFVMLPIPGFIERLPFGPFARLQGARARLDRTIHRLVAERMKDGGDRGDLLSMLLAARDVEGDGRGMSAEALRDELLTLFLAGHETTANALAWSLYLVAGDASVQARLASEAGTVLAGRAPRGEDFERLPYARAVFSEALRLYPPAWILGRRAVRGTEIAGVAIPERAIVIVSPWVMHRDARWFASPDRFAPERWLGEPAAPKDAFVPFGNGTRRCIGESFAWMEGTLALAACAAARRFERTTRTSGATRVSITLRPAHGIELAAVSR